jgi:formylglycine-generating enzyme required for sulfatase activity
MDQVVHTILRFDCFLLDLTRGSLRKDERDIDLRPKAFEVLRHLAQNAGRLVSKQELYDAVWPNITVSDDSLVQCIRELRHKLGDDGHRLIKTVPRRGYLMDTILLGPPADLPGESTTTASKSLRDTAETPAATGHFTRTMLMREPRMWLGVLVGVICIASGAAYQLGWPTSYANPGHAGIAKDAAVIALTRPSFKDCEDCPEMVALPAGEFMMGAPPDERFRQEDDGLPRRVVIGKRVAIGKFEVTNDQFSAFIADTGTTLGNTCKAIVGFDGGYAVFGPAEASFRQPGFEISGAHPVVCVSWHEAQAYAAWLKRRTGRPYRLPTEAEWEYAARAETETMYSFGSDETLLCAFARFADLDSQFGWRTSCRSNNVTYGPIPVGQLKPNPWGLFDMHGNAWEWVEDCWTPIASEIPTDGSAFSRAGKCEMGVVRGGSFASGARRLRSAARLPTPVAAHYHNYGFRVALSLDPG